MRVSGSAGTHCFFGGSPLNFWGELTDGLIEDSICDIAGHGFSSVYLLVPWAVFVDDSGSDPVRNERSLQLYESVLRICRDHSLSVHARISYLWESLPHGTSTFSRFADFFSDRRHRSCLRLFLKSLKEVESRIGTKVRHFLSWEDLYWPIFYHWRAQSLERRAKLASDCGYDLYCGLHSAYARGQDTITAIPTLMSTDGIRFAQYYDSTLLPVFFKILDEEGLDVGFEYRIDSDHVGDYLFDGKILPSYYHWNRAHPYVKQKYIYFHQNLGGPVDKELNADTAIDQIQWLLRTQAPMRLHGEQPLVIDQFNFIDSTVATWSRLNEKNVGEFLGRASAVTEKWGVSVVLWSYVDWCKDIVHNGRFVSGTTGWKIEGTCPSSHDILGDTGCLTLSTASVLRQVLSLSLPDNCPITLEIECAATVRPVTVRAGLGSTAVEKSVDNQEFSSVRLIFERFEGMELTIEATDAPLTIRRVRLYDRVYSQGGLRLDHSLSPSFDAFSKSFLKVDPT